jgi:hypothetical protein
MMAGEGRILIEERIMKNKYDYLLDRRIITAEDLNKAYHISQETNKSIEAILIVCFGVKRKTLGKSLSIYYDCPFRIYDSNLPIPLSFLARLKQSVLLNECWVPYSWKNNGIEVLVEDPWDFTKNEKIRVHLKASRVNYSVAIKEDIEDFIGRLFDEKQNLIIEMQQDDYFSNSAENIR